MRACTPTGISASNIELEDTSVSASTLHCFFGVDGSYEGRVDFSKRSIEKADAVIALEVLLLDEMSSARPPSPPMYPLPRCLAVINLYPVALRCPCST